MIIVLFLLLTTLVQFRNFQKVQLTEERQPVQNYREEQFFIFFISSSHLQVHNYRRVSRITTSEEAVLLLGNFNSTEYLLVVVKMHA